MTLKIIRDEIAYDGKYKQMILRHFLDRDGKPQVWEMVKHKMPGKIVAAVAVTHKQEVILLKHFRLPSKSYILEPCAGLMDKDGETKEQAMRRELLEETGYTVEKLICVMQGYFNSGLLADEIVMYIGMGAKKAQEPAPEPSEDITVITIPLAQLHSYLTSPPDGIKVDVKLFGALYFLEKFFVQ